MSESAFAPLAALEPLMDKCVHCGFCLPTCPSYLLLGQEADSPRGRIYLMRAGTEGRASLGTTFAARFDTCLGCMACETACPSGVRYAPLLEETRATIERHLRRPLLDRLFRAALFRVLPYPRRLRWLRGPLALARALQRSPRLLGLLPARLRSAAALASAMPLPAPAARLPERVPAVGVPRRRVGLVAGCVQRAFFGHVNEATLRVLAAEGCEVLVPRDQGCCGALGLHAGRDEQARAFARQLIATFEPLDLDEIVVNAAGCGSTLKQYGELLKHDPIWAARAQAFAARVRDVTETLAGLMPLRTPLSPVPGRVAYHDACHLAHAQGVRWEPRRLLAAVPGLTLVPLGEGDICCGSAGIFNLVQPAMAATLGARKADRVAEAEADVVVTSNPGCIAQIGAATITAGRPRPVLHVVEVLDRSMRGGVRVRRETRSE